MEWFEDLPDDCPPVKAQPPNEDTFYRTVWQFPPTERDFLSHVRLYPNKNFHDLCKASSLSLMNSLRECCNLFKLPKFRNKNSKIVKITLPPEGGIVLHTPSRQSKAHYSWWRAKQYDPIPDCREVQRTLYEEYIRIER